MSDDIVRGLRLIAEEFSRNIRNNTGLAATAFTGRAKIVTDAADEIERLRFVLADRQKEDDEREMRSMKR